MAEEQEIIDFPEETESADSHFLLLTTPLGYTYRISLQNGGGIPLEVQEHLEDEEIHANFLEENSFLTYLPQILNTFQHLFQPSPPSLCQASLQMSASAFEAWATANAGGSWAQQLLFECASLNYLVNQSAGMAINRGAVAGYDLALNGPGIAVSWDQYPCSREQKKFKEKIKNPLEKLDILEGLTYLQEIGGRDYEGCGIVAEELEALNLPGLVSKDENGEYKSINLLGLIPVLVEAIKALRIEISKLKGEE